MAFRSAFRTPSENCSRKSRKEVTAGYQRIKIKIKPGWDVDVVREVQKPFPVHSLDVRRQFRLHACETLTSSSGLDEFKLLMIEQPLAWNDIIDHIQLQKAIQTPICLDESILDAEDARKAHGFKRLQDHQYQAGSCCRTHRSEKSA